MLQLWRVALEDLGLLPLLEGKSDKNIQSIVDNKFKFGLWYVVFLQPVESEDLRASSATENQIRFSKNLTFHSWL